MTQYFQRLPRVTYSAGQVVLAAIENETDESDGESEEDASPSNMPTSTNSDDFNKICQRAVLKCIPRGQRLMRAGYVLTMLDCERDNHYFVKRQIQASMERDIRTATTTIFKDTGDILNATCTCKAKELQRCGHIAALQCLLLKHIEIAGREAVTCTGRPYYWAVKPPGKDPGYIAEKNNYREEPFYFHRRVTFDVRPTAAQDTPMTPEQRQRFHTSVKEKLPQSLLWSHIGPTERETAPNPHGVGPTQTETAPNPHGIGPTETETAPNPHGNAEQVNSTLASIPDEETSEAVALKCSEFLWNLNQIRKVQFQPYEVPGTEAQRDSALWRHHRSYRCTASECKLVLGLRKDSAKIRHLQTHFWEKPGRRCRVWSMQYGIDHEDEARDAYEKIQKDEDPQSIVVKSGLWINPKYPQLCCSPDGFLFTSRQEKILLEIKCLTLTYVDPSHFEDFMPPEKMKSFYLRRLPDKSLALKENHAYNYQVQMCLDILELETAHLFVWSESGHAVVTVKRDTAFFLEKRARLIYFHRAILLPEVFLKRARNSLPPLELQYSQFHEDEDDKYFEVHTTMITAFESRRSTNW